ncbi:hypothetical protein EVG20_g1908 [Dentipellis fragilis]|uniref:Uncharacterized protein n=1 Tax=Dentipellis fragilis TaxID=205917 RepID=A0A4Y9ZAS8_9AGAM|nr:hypothetical protein EVG20_g1908 [Dentipellis fragilis]
MTALCASAAPVDLSGKLDIRDAGTINPVSFPANTNTVQVVPPGTDTVYHDTATVGHNTANPVTVAHDTETYDPIPATRVPRAPSVPTLTFDPERAIPTAIETFQPGDEAGSTFTGSVDGEGDIEAGLHAKGAVATLRCALSRLIMWLWKRLLTVCMKRWDSVDLHARTSRRFSAAASPNPGGRSLFALIAGTAYSSELVAFGRHWHRLLYTTRLLTTDPFINFFHMHSSHFFALLGMTALCASAAPVIPTGGPTTLLPPITTHIPIVIHEPRELRLRPPIEPPVPTPSIVEVINHAPRDLRLRPPVKPPPPTPSVIEVINHAPRFADAGSVDIACTYARTDNGNGVFMTVIVLLFRSKHFSLGYLLFSCLSTLHCRRSPHGLMLYFMGPGISLQGVTASANLSTASTLTSLTAAIAARIRIFRIESHLTTALLTLAPFTNFTDMHFSRVTIILALTALGASAAPVALNGRQDGLPRAALRALQPVGASPSPATVAALPGGGASPSVKAAAIRRESIPVSLPGNAIPTAFPTALPNSLPGVPIPSADPATAFGASIPVSLPGGAVPTALPASLPGAPIPSAPVPIPGGPLIPASGPVPIVAAASTPSAVPTSVSLDDLDGELGFTGAKSFDTTGVDKRAIKPPFKDELMPGPIVGNLGIYMDLRTMTVYSDCLCFYGTDRINASTKFSAMDNVASALDDKNGPSHGQSSQVIKAVKLSPSFLQQRSTQLTFALPSTSRHRLPLPFVSAPSESCLTIFRSLPPNPFIDFVDMHSTRVFITLALTALCASAAPVDIKTRQGEPIGAPLSAGSGSLASGSAISPPGLLPLSGTAGALSGAAIPSAIASALSGSGAPAIPSAVASALSGGLAIPSAVESVLSGGSAIPSAVESALSGLPAIPSGLPFSLPGAPFQSAIPTALPDASAASSSGPLSKPGGPILPRGNARAAARAISAAVPSAAGSGAPAAVAASAVPVSVEEGFTGAKSFDAVGEPDTGKRDFAARYEELPMPEVGF